MTLIKKVKKVTEEKEVITSVRCDNCGKIATKEYTPDSWYRFSSFHREWGNDSIDSYEYYDVCSPECYIEKFIIEVAEMEHIQSGKVADMEIQFARRLAEYFKNIKQKV